MKLRIKKVFGMRSATTGSRAIKFSIERRDLFCWYPLVSERGGKRDYANEPAEWGLCENDETIELVLFDVPEEAIETAKLIESANLKTLQSIHNQIVWKNH